MLSKYWAYSWQSSIWLGQIVVWKFQNFLLRKSLLRTENHKINRIDKDGKHLPMGMCDKIKIQNQ